MKNLTQAQQEEVKILVRLGDSLELAIKTVLNKKIKDSSLYYEAYNI